MSTFAIVVIILAALTISYCCVKCYKKRRRQRQFTQGHVHHSSPHATTHITIEQTPQGASPVRVQVQCTLTDSSSVPPTNMTSSSPQAAGGYPVGQQSQANTQATSVSVRTKPVRTQNQNPSKAGVRSQATQQANTSQGKTTASMSTAKARRSHLETVRPSAPPVHQGDEREYPPPYSVVDPSPTKQ